MRRRSFSGPLILIFLGGLFLWNNLRPDVPLWNLVSTYWPFFLIAWGVLQLIEIGASAAAGKPLPRGIGGGGIVLVLFVCLIGSGMYTATRHGWQIGPNRLEMFGEQFDYQVNQQAAAAGVRRVVFQNMRGNLRISGGDLQEVRISGRKTIRAFRKSDADQADRTTPIEISTEGDRLVVRGNQDRVSGDRRVTADLEVVVPRAIAIEAQDRTGDIDVTDVAGDVEVSSDHSDVRLTRLGGNARVSLRRSELIRAVDIKGTIDLEGHGSDIQLENVAGQVTIAGSYSGSLNFRNLAKPLHFESANTDLQVRALPGQISMSLGDFSAKNLVGPIHLKTKSKDVKIEDYTDSLELETDRGDIEIQPGRLPLGKIDAHSRSGKIELAIPDKAVFQLQATAAHGQVMNDYGPPIEKQSDGRSSSLKGGTGQGAAISITTDRGSVLVRKSGAETEKAGLQPEKF